MVTNPSSLILTRSANRAIHRVRLTTYGIDVELTATARVGLHRYRFPSEAQAAVILDLAEALGLADMGQATLRRVDDRRVEGSVVNLPTHSAA